MRTQNTMTKLPIADLQQEVHCYVNTEGTRRSGYELKMIFVESHIDAPKQNVVYMSTEEAKKLIKELQDTIHVIESL